MCCNNNCAFRVRNKDPYNSHCLPLHIAVLVELKKSNCKYLLQFLVLTKLFLIILDVWKY